MIMGPLLSAMTVDERDLEKHRVSVDAGGWHNLDRTPQMY
jgi:hypothetical protein